MRTLKHIFLFIGSLSIIVFIYKCYFSAPLYEIHHQAQVRSLFHMINADNMWNDLGNLSRFPDRGAAHKRGDDAAYWIKSRLDLIAEKSGREDIGIYLVPTRNYDINGNRFISSQPSIILRIGATTNPGIVIGAHLDTRACKQEDGSDDPDCKKDKSGPYPGADDDGSGTVTLLEMARTLLASNIHFNKPVYLIWYAAEENGRIGSKSVVKYFQQQHIPVAAVMQLDMTGYQHENDSTLWFDDYHTNYQLTAFSQQLVRYYLNQPAGTMHDKGGESDHWSWNDAGAKTVFPFESDCHNSPACPRRQHTSADTMDKLSLQHMTAYLKLAIAFAVELSQH